MGETIIICPSAEELSSVCSEIGCPEKDCSATFQSTSNLNMHLIKHHKANLDNLMKKMVVCKYHCPVNMCVYTQGGKKHFTKLKYLKQHYLKVHATKTLVCEKCDKRFSTESFKKLHVKSCGKLFTCVCGSTYNSSEAFLTHCKRKGNGHSIHKTVLSKRGAEGSNERLNATKYIQSPIKKSERFIYPKLSNDVSFPIRYIAAIALSELSTPCNLSKVSHKGIQTDPFDQSAFKEGKKNLPVLKVSRKRKNSQQTQTVAGRWKKLKISAETQTNSDYLRQKHKHFQKNTPKKRKKSMETQTKECVTTFLLDQNICKAPAFQTTQPPVETNSDSKFLDAESLVDEIFQDSSSPSSSDLKCIHVEDQNNLKVEDKCSKSKDVLNEDRTKKWIWDNSSFTKTEVVSSELTGQSLVTTVKNELFSANHELNICSRELDELNTFRKRDNLDTENMFDISRLCNIETQTEIDTLLTECSEDTSFTLCSTTETQTTDDFESLLYSNMCTQTNEEVDQLFNFNFVDIETQTAWPDLDS